MKILVVDDEYVALSRMVKLFSRWGEAEGATNATQALAMTEKALSQGVPYDIISIDIELPDSDGLELMKQIKKIELTMGLEHPWVSKKIIISARSQHDNIQKALALGCDDFLVKPVTLATLEEKMNQIWS
ncbi:MAG: response regulator [Spirochaetaceae bacterium]|jgi:two-component system chemotaxis response regulator CheY|nr:response regulator [Spirochaetaceae bacterium]